MIELGQVVTGDMIAVGLLGFVAHHIKVLRDLRDSDSVKSNPLCYLKNRYIKVAFSVCITIAAFIIIVQAAPAYFPNAWASASYGFIFFSTFLSELFIDRTGSLTAKKWESWFQ